MVLLLMVKMVKIDFTVSKKIISKQFKTVSVTVGGSFMVQWFLKVSLSKSV